MEDEELVCAADRLQDLRSLVLDALSNDMSTTACWYADKLVTMSKGNAEDVLLLARTYYASGDFARTARALETHKAYGAEPLAQFRRGDTGDDAAVELRARLLAARALAKCGRHADCVSTLEPAMADIENYEGVTQQEEDDDDEELDSPSSSSSAHHVKVDLAAAACSVVGQAYEALENRSRAVEWLKRALELDPRCAEAVSFLVERRLLSSSDESRLSSQLSRAVGKSNEWIGAVYGARLCVHPGLEPSSDRFDALDRVHGLGDNNEVLCARAEHYYYAHDSRSAHRLAKRVYNNDPFDFACVPVYLASMVELKLSHELFYCAHELVKSYPKRAASWFAVGCYYLLVGKNDAAQRYFHKSAKTCPRFAPAWIGFGNAFAAQDESEQAMAAYRSASRLFQGSHVPLLFIGMEYLRTNNLPLAKHFLRGAKALCPSTDPVVSNELGVVELRQGNYHDAEETFLESLELFQRLPERSPLRRACESSLFNLAQCYRKMRQFDKAAHYFELALSLKPRDPAIRAALGAVYHVFGGSRLHQAVDCYHVALGVRPDDTFASEMLARALKQVADLDEPKPFHTLYRHIDKQQGNRQEEEQEVDLGDLRLSSSARKR